MRSYVNFGTLGNLWNMYNLFSACNLADNLNGCVCDNLTIALCIGAASQLGHALRYYMVSMMAMSL